MSAGHATVWETILAMLVALTVKTMILHGHAGGSLGGAASLERVVDVGWNWRALRVGEGEVVGEPFSAS